MQRIGRSAHGRNGWALGAAAALTAGAGVVGVACAPRAALAGGTPENIVLIIDPTDPTSLFVGNYYKAARNIPDANVLYVRSAAANYQEFSRTNRAAFLDTLAQRGLANHADYALVAPMEPFFVPASGLVTDGCFPVNRFSIGSAYSLAFIDAEVRAGVASTLANQYVPPSGNNTRFAFDSNTSYFQGEPSTDPRARRYFIGAMLGYTGANGNTVAEVLAMIDRSVAVDATRPTAGTFYFQNNTADPARNVRAGQYNAVVTALQQAGFTAIVRNDILPFGQSDCLGVMTGAAGFDLPGAGVTLRPGAFGDHLTSFAGTFDITTGQTRMSVWIRQGASATSGTVEEPCNYTGKFVNARFHQFYALGMSLGEAWTRNHGFVPFQSLLLGDPMTRPWARLPVVTVPGFPTQPVAGEVVLAPQATTTSGSPIRGFDLIVDGAGVGVTIPPGQTFTLDTSTLPDGPVDVRVLGSDSLNQRNTGRFLGTLVVNNRGRSASLAPTATAGDLGAAFTFALSSAGPGTPVETRLLHNGRVVAAVPGGAGSVTVFGQTLGAGPALVRAETLYADGGRARSGPVVVNINPAGGGAGPAPVAFSYTKFVTSPTLHAVELPATFSDSLKNASFTLVQGPTNAAVESTLGAGPVPYVLIRPNAGARGSETITFRVTTPSGTSNLGTVTLVYSTAPACRADLNNDAELTFDDIQLFVSLYNANDPRADFNTDGEWTFDDIQLFVQSYNAGC